MNVLVTGSHGFIGHYLCKYLESRKKEVIPFDIAEDPWQDFRDKAAVDQVFRDFDIDVVCHLGAQAYLGPAEAAPIENAGINILGSINVFEAALRNNTRVIYHSTGAVYGDGCEQPVDEWSPTEPKSHYGASKLCAEEYLLLYVRRGLRGLRTRFSSVYGIGRDAAPVNVFTKKGVLGEPITVFGPEVTRDYTHVSDVVKGVASIVDNDGPGWDGTAYNIASGRPTKTMDVVWAVEKALGVDLDVTVRPAKKGDILQNYFNINEMRDTFNYDPQVALEDGIKELVRHYKKVKENAE